MVEIADLADGRVALDVDLANLTRRHLHRRVFAFLRDQLHGRTGAARDLAALANLELHVVNLGAQRNVFQRQRIPGQDVHVRPGNNRVAHFQAERLENVPFLPVRVGQQRDARRAIRVVLDRRDLRRDIVFVALEVDDSVHPLVAAAAPPRSELSAVVAAARLMQRLDERLVRLGRCDIVERLNGLKPRPRRRRVVFANRHDYAPSRNSGIFWPSRSFT